MRSVPVLPWLIATTLALVPGPVLGDDHATCANAGPEAIAACSHLIESNTLSNGQRAEALNNRALAYTEADEIPEAIADLKEAVKNFDEAIRREPRRAALFHGRADAHKMLQNGAQAIADYDEAYRLDPKDVFARQAAAQLRASVGQR